MRLDAHWSPFTSNKAFNDRPRLLKSAQGLYWTTEDDRQVLDMTAGLWCTNLGHGRERVASAMYASAKQLDYAPSFGFGHADSFALAERLAELAPGNLDHAFFTGSGSESVDTALKMAQMYFVARGQPSRRMFVARERAYHGVNLGGTATGGIPANCRAFAPLAAVEFLADTQDLERSAFSRGQPAFGGDRADELERIVARRGAENIAAVIVEPIQGAGGVIVPPVGYLERLREICDAHDILLIFDEVVCAFGRTGSFTASQQFAVQPDLMTMAKGLTSGTVPMGAVMCSSDIYDTVVRKTPPGIEFPHGYTYSAHPLACAAAQACLDIYEEEGLFTRAAEGIGRCLEDALHDLRSDEVVDVRNYGLLGAIQFAPSDDPTPIGVQVFNEAWANGVMVRGLADSIVVSPPLIVEEKHIDEFVDKVRRAVNTVVAKRPALSGAAPAGAGGG